MHENIMSENGHHVKHDSPLPTTSNDSESDIGLRVNVGHEPTATHNEHHQNPIRAANRAAKQAIGQFTSSNEQGKHPLNASEVSGEPVEAPRIDVPFVNSKPCPKCGGDDRFYRIPQSEAYDNQPAWFCRQCSYSELDTSTPLDESASKREPLTDEELAAVWEVNKLAVTYCENVLWSPKGREALDYLRHRGFSDELIKELRLGYHNPKLTGPYLRRDYGFGGEKKDRQAAMNAGLVNKFGYLRSVLKNVITIPYIVDGEIVMLRARSLDDNRSAKYLSPTGSLFAGGKPYLYLHDVLKELRAKGIMQIALTEGEFKASAMYGAWQTGSLPFPAVGQTGIGYLPDELLDDLRDFTVYLIYDSEEREDAFQMSPGEKFTITNGRKLLGWHLSGKIKSAQSRVKSLEKNGGTDKEIEEANLSLHALRLEQERAKARNIKVKVVRLPRLPDEKKTDLDAFLLKHGASTLNLLIERAQFFGSWYSRHGGHGYKFKNDGIYQGNDHLANYQAILAENIRKDDGVGFTYDRAILVRCRLPIGHALTERVVIEADDWADQRQAMNIIRANLPQGASFDEGAKTLRAIKELSLAGDGPGSRVVFTVTGWQYLNTGWHFLTGKGAIGKDGVTTTVSVELNKDYKMGGYTLGIGEGDPKKGWEGTKLLLSSDVAPKAVCYMLLSHAALAIIHRFTENEARPVPFIYGESGSLKTSLCRVFLSYFGPRFTAVRKDGCAILKWGSDTAKMMLNAMFYARDVMAGLDDYKKATVRAKDLALVLHSISEGSGRGRLTQRSKVMASKPPRGLAIATGESLPAKDKGQLGRILPFPLRKSTRNQQGDVNKAMLAVAQEYGEDSHFAALMREFIQYIAGQLDTHGEDEFKKYLRLVSRRDTLELDVDHERANSGLRQNYIGFAVFSAFLLAKGYISNDEYSQIAHEYEEARQIIAGSHSHVSSIESPAEIFLSVIRDGLHGREIYLEGEVFPEYDTPKEDDDDGFEPFQKGKLIGFYSSPRNGKHAVALFPNAAFEYVQTVLSRQGERIEYSKNDIWAQLHSAGYINKVDKAKKYRGNIRYDARTLNKVTGKRVRSINLDPSAVLEEADETVESPVPAPPRLYPFPNTTESKHDPDDPFGW